MLADSLIGPAAAALLSTVAAILALRLWQWRPGTPLSLQGDGIFVINQVGSLLRQSPYAVNPHLGAPFGQSLGWFPTADDVHYLVMRGIGLFTDSPITVSAVYFFLGFPAAALSMYWLARTCRVTRIGSVVAGVLFAIVPGHQTLFPHLTLASYWVVPLAVWLALRLAPSQRPLSAGGWRASLRVLLVVVVVGLGNVYYVVFAVILTTSVLAARTVAGYDRRRLAEGAAIIAALLGVAGASLWLSLKSTGADLVTGLTAGQRTVADSERYAGKLMDLVLPWREHRSEDLRLLTAAYTSATDAPTYESAAIGVVSLVGVVFLLALTVRVVRQGDRDRPAKLAPTLTLLLLVSFAFYTKGGLGSLTALFFNPQIRTWSRLSIVIALIGLFAVGLALTMLQARRGRIITVAVAVGLLVLGAGDQTNPDAAPDYTSLRHQLSDITAFTDRLESQLPPGCAIFQLPVVQFPESAPVHDLTDYDLLLPSLTSSQLRWSYGAMRGTAAADWQLALPAANTGPLLDDLAAAGFCALQVDVAGYSPGTAPNPALRDLLGEPLAVSADQRWSTYDLRLRRTELLESMGAAAVQQRAERVLHPLIVRVQGAQSEDDGARVVQWVGRSARLVVSNLAPAPTEVTVSFGVQGAGPASRTVTVTDPDGSMRTVTTDETRAATVTVTITAQPGMNVIAVETDHAPAERGRAAGIIDLVAAASGPDVRVVSVP